MCYALNMKSCPSGKNARTGKPAFGRNTMQHAPQDGPNWTLIVGGAIVSTLSVTFGRKLKRALEMSRHRDISEVPNETGICPVHSNLYHCRADGLVCIHHVPGSSDGTVEMKRGSHGARCQFQSNGDITRGTQASQQCKLQEIPRRQVESMETSSLWASPEQLDLSNRPLQQSNSSDSMCTSDAGSDLYSKRDVIHRLRQQLKRRDEMILEMQAQITDQQQTISNQLSHTANLQSQLDAVNRDLFGAEREIQRLRKAIADHCAGHTVDMSCSPGTITNNHASVGNSENRVIPSIKGTMVGSVQVANAGAFLQEQNLLEQRYDVRTPDVRAWGLTGDLQCLSLDDNRNMNMHECCLQRVKDLEIELAELKQLVSGKNFLLEAYENQRIELCSELKELQLKLGNHVASIL